MLFESTLASETFQICKKNACVFLHKRSLDSRGSEPFEFCPLLSFPAGEAVTVDIPILQTRGLSNRPQDGLLTLLRRAALFESTRIRESHTHTKQKAPA